MWNLSSLIVYFALYESLYSPLFVDERQMYQPKTVPGSSLVCNNSLVHGQHLDCSASTMDPISGGNSLINNPNLAPKQRLRWTHELHERFVDAVAQLGGPDRESHQKFIFYLDMVIKKFYMDMKILTFLYGKGV